MLSPEDFVKLSYTPDLTQAGIIYACRSIPYTYDRMGGSVFNRMRRIVAGKAVELAFRRSLVSQKVPHNFEGRTPFTEPDHYDVCIGGHRCDLKSFQLFDKKTIQQVNRDPGCLLEAAALVPADQFRSNGSHDEDIYLFGFITAMVAAAREDIERAVAAGQPSFLIHILPPRWSQPVQWKSLGRLALKSESPEAVEVELGGQAESREFQVEQVTLQPLQRTEVQKDYNSLAYLRAVQHPQERIGLSSPYLGKPYIIQPNEWGNIWVYGMSIYLVGYITRGEFRRKAKPLPGGSQVFQYRRTQVKNLSLPVSALHSLPDLYTKAREWQSDCSNLS